MKKFGKVLSLLLVLTMVFALMAGCGDSSNNAPSGGSEPAAQTSDAPADGTDDGNAQAGDDAQSNDDSAEPVDGNAGGSAEVPKLTIGYVTINNSAPWGGSAMSNGLQAACDQRGWTLKILDSEADVVKLGEQVNSLIDAAVDVLVIFGGDPTLNVDHVKAASDAGIPVFMAALDVAEEGRQYVAACVGPDQEQMCYDIGQYVINDFGADAGAKVVIISGVPFLQDYIDREHGFARAMDETNFEVLETQHAYSSRPDAKAFMENYIAAYGDSIDILMGFDDDLTMGGVAAIEEAGMTGKIAVYSLTGQNDAIQAVKDGQMKLTVMNRADGIMAEMGNAIEEYFATGSTEYYHYTDLVYIDSTNVDDYIGKGEF